MLAGGAREQDRHGRDCGLFVGNRRPIGMDRVGDFNILLFVCGRVRARTQGQPSMEFRAGGDDGLRLLLNVRGAPMVGRAVAGRYRLRDCRHDSGQPCA